MCGCVFCLAYATDVVNGWKDATAIASIVVETFKAEAGWWTMSGGRIRGILQRRVEHEEGSGDFPFHRYV